MTDEEYISRIEGIWEKYKNLNPFCNLSPLCYVGMPENGLAIIGLNPSLPRSTVLEHIMGVTAPQVFDIKYIKESTEKDGYHDSLKKLAAEICDFAKLDNLDWGHADLFYFRETNSLVLKKNLYLEKNWSFFWEQIETTWAYVNGKNPRAILVNNAFSSDLIFHHWMNNCKECFDEQIGTYRVNDIPIFFSSMLSGPSPLDKGNRRRLAWHIGQIFREVS